MRLLLVEDDEMLALSLTRYLRTAGFAVDHVSSARNASAMGLQENYRTAILDIGLPDGSGLEVLKTWRQARSELPVLLLTARGGWQDKVNGLKAGADDYLAKPFHNEELLARINALIRRSEGRVHGFLQASGYELDEERQRVRTPEGLWHGLTGTEFRLLRCLMARPDRVFSKEELLEQLYNLDAEPSHNVIEAYIRRLRRLIGQDAIKTLRGQGYVFDSSQ
jgi:two-component system OmpR family response regulator